VAGLHLPQDADAGNFLAGTPTLGQPQGSTLDGVLDDWLTLGFRKRRGGSQLAWLALECCGGKAGTDLVGGVEMCASMSPQCIMYMESFLAFQNSNWVGHPALNDNL
jgi:hypothetical protein